jgi:hypothetical protein
MIPVEHKVGLDLRIHAVEHKQAQPQKKEADKHPPVVFAEL